MYQRVVVPLDGSDLAERALPHAEALARVTGGRLHLVRVLENLYLARLAGYPVSGPYVEMSVLQQSMEDEEREAERYLGARTSDLLARGVAATTEARWGRAAEEIIAAERPDDIVVMSTHGRGGISRWFMGSVAEDVVRKSTVPVLLVRSAAGASKAPAEGASVFRRIVVPLDGSALAEAALPPAEDLAHLSHAPLHLVSVIDYAQLHTPPFDSSYRALGEALAAEHASRLRYLDRTRGSVATRGHTVTSVIRDGVPAREVLAETRPGDAVVLATHGRSGPWRWFMGSVAEAIVRQAAVPVLVVHHGPDAVTSTAHEEAVRPEAGEPVAPAGPSTGRRSSL